MLTIIDNPTFTREVNVKTPVDGGFKTETLKATFRVVPVREMAEFQLDDEAGTTAFLERIVERLDDICDVKGNVMPFNNDVRDLVLGLAYVRTALVETYVRSVSGALEGN